ncbi:hypothetical protein JL720_13965 [Aureococcus anophagefferens]|nr:hypothetical protein JL720_13965 [Aureococcus anophagefferens]
MAVKSLLYGRTHDVERLVSVYKRTYFSTDPFHDGEFLQNILGMNVITSQLVSRPAVNGSSGDGTSTCAKREVLTTLDNFQLHFFHSFMYPGHESSNRWVQAWSEEHENLSKERWDVFSAPSLTLYSPWLTPFIRRVEREGISHLRYYQEHETGSTLYSLLINIPYSGLTIEVVSDEDLVTSKTVDHNTLEAMIERMCPYSLMVHQDPRTLRKVHEKLGGLSANSHGLPDLLMVSMAFPTTVPARALLRVRARHAGHLPVGEQFESATCKTWEVELASTMKLNGSLVVNPVHEGRREPRRSARPGNYTLTNLEHEVNGTHHKYMDSPNSGWDSWIDMHPGLHVNTLLDGAPEAMRKNGFQYTMHPSCVGCNAGSMWSSGITPWSMEIQGAFSKDDEIRKQSLIDYCSPTSNGDTRININEIRDGLVG